MISENVKEWHIDKRVSISHILTTVVLGLALIAAWYNQDTRLSVLENQQNTFNERIMRVIERQEATDNRQDQEIQQLRREIRDDLRYLRESVDRFVRQGEE